MLEIDGLIIKEIETVKPFQRCTCQDSLVSVDYNIWFEWYLDVIQCNHNKLPFVFFVSTR